MNKLANISYETPSKTFFIKKEGMGLYRVYKNGPTAAHVCATFNFPGNAAKSLALAIDRANALEKIKFGEA